MNPPHPGLLTHTRIWLRTRGFHVVFALATMFLQSGCTTVLVGAGAGVAGVAYAHGELRESLSADPRVVAAAAEKALEVMDIRKISANSSAIDAVVIGRTATDRRILIKVRVDANGQSHLSIRVGQFGDEMISRRIHEEIRKQLPAAAPGPVRESPEAAI